jgi:two-component system sensor histidine kinase KdpD
MTDTIPARGRLKVFLGYAAGVGKTYQMLSEAHELKRQGVDLVVGYFEPHGRHDTIALAEGLEIVPRRTIEYRGSRFEEMDTDAILRRHPQVAVVDEFPHTNVPGSERVKRWEDVHVLLEAGIDVTTTMNIQHLESLNDQIWQSTGVRVRETIPDWVLKQADEVVMVDLTPRALLNRLARGVVYPPERARAALENFFKESTLVALREIAMRQAAYAVESRLPDEEPAEALPGAASGPTCQERLLLVIGPGPSSAALIRRGRRVADYLRAECLAVHVSRTTGSGELPAAEQASLERNFNFARGLLIETRVLVGDNVADTIVNFARLQRVTQIFMTREKTSAWRGWFAQPLAQQIVNRARDMQVPPELSVLTVSLCLSDGSLTARSSRLVRRVHDAPHG